MVLFGCGKTKPTEPAESVVPQATASASPAPTSTPEVLAPVTMTLYYGNVEGDELVHKEVTLTPTTASPIYLEALKALTKSPDDQAVALFEGFTFLSADQKQGKLTIDLALPKESQLGAPGEELLLNSLKKTMFQFKEINAIEVLVNGQKVESLLGHMDLPHPIVK
jgi:spore germination protein GerM